MKRIEKIIYLSVIGALMVLFFGGIVLKPTEIKLAESKPQLICTNVKVEERLAQMTLEEMVCQMFIVKPEVIAGEQTVTKVSDNFRKKLKQYPVGGIAYYQKNLKNPTQTKEMLSLTMKYAKEDSGIPIFLCVDEEGGRVARIANQTAFGVKNVGPMCEIKTEKEALEVGDTIGEYLAELGFNFDFAPVADVITNDKNEVVKDRSFGSDPEVVTEFATAVSQGLQSHGIKSCFKHLPGHGATAEDTHQGLAYTDKTYEELLESELVPFEMATEAGISSIMVSHISVPNVTGSDIPSTLSYKIITEILREDLGYSGLVITDAMNMKAITDNYDCATATVMAVQAGADMILSPEDFQVARKALIKAVEDGEISRERIEDSVRRILIAKNNM